MVRRVGFWKRRTVGRADITDGTRVLIASEIIPRRDYPQSVIEADGGMDFRQLIRGAWETQRWKLCCWFDRVAKEASNISWLKRSRQQHYSNFGQYPILPQSLVKFAAHILLANCQWLLKTRSPNVVILKSLPFSGFSLAVCDVGSEHVPIFPFWRVRILLP
jgi:hypothetical protein